ncbi:hypothetical protein C8J57DRAFT_1710463 [Mycena rebaudengoi]|nr:hypothetical protein C8J57DRAFT_1710463 [Mycena rebaudengoi]
MSDCASPELPPALFSATSVCPCPSCPMVITEHSIGEYPEQDRRPLPPRTLSFSNSNPYPPSNASAAPLNGTNMRKRTLGLVSAQRSLNESWDRTRDKPLLGDGRSGASHAVGFAAAPRHVRLLHAMSDVLDVQPSPPALTRGWVVDYLPDASPSRALPFPHPITPSYLRGCLGTQLLVGIEDGFPPIGAAVASHRAIAHFTAVGRTSRVLSAMYGHVISAALF